MRGPQLACAAIVAVSTVPGAMLCALTWWLLRRAQPNATGAAIAVRDYLNLWAGGTLARDGAVTTVFEPAGYAAWLRATFGPALPLHTWSYPPPLLFLAGPVSALPLVPGFAVWTAGTALVLLAVLRGCRVGWPACLCVLLSPAAIENALAGQNGALSAAALMGGLLLVDRRPAAAGVLLGLLAVKPQLGLLVPVCLLAAGHWRTAAAAAATGSLAAAASWAVWGGDAWLRFLTVTRHFMVTEVLEHPPGAGFQHIMATPFMLLRMVGAPLQAAYAVQAVVTAVCAGLSWRAWRQPHADPAARAALTACLAVLATPYGFSYDMVAVAAGIVLLAGMALRTGLLPCEAPLLAACWLWPGLAFWLGGSGLPPLGCLALAGAAFCAWRRLHPAVLLRQHDLGVAGAAARADGA